MRLKASFLLAMGCSISAAGWANVPEECIQAPERQSYCPHTLYRVARVEIPSLAITKGNMVCLCLTDLTDLPANRQQDAFTAIAREYALPPLALFRLLEISPPEWVQSELPVQP